jgi:hypothetical protein
LSETSLTGGDSQDNAHNNGRGYSTWEQVAGYFDGDGSPKVHYNVFTMTLEITWSDKDIEILEHMRAFLQTNDVIGVLGKFRTGEAVYYELSVSEGNNALEAMKMMLPHLDKKWSQVKGGIEYLENRITGDEFIRILNEAIRTKKRSSNLVTRSMPYTKKQGKRMREDRPDSRALTREQVVTIRYQNESLGLSYTKLAKIYGVNPSTIYLSLRKYTWSDRD